MKRRPLLKKLRDGAYRIRRGPLRNGVLKAQAAAPFLRHGRVPGPPDFVGIGVQRSGTSWWYSLLEQHPQIVSLGFGAKELHYFDGFWERDPSADEIDEYHAQFLRKPEQICGEWTPRYMYDSWALPALLKAAPDVRLVVLLRDPLARFHSGLRHQLQRTGRIDGDTVHAAFGRGCYGTQLTNVFDVVPQSRVLVLQTEKCQRDPMAMLRVNFEFLGLPHAKVSISKPINQTEGHVAVTPSLLEHIRARYATEVATLAELCGDRIDLALWSDYTLES